MIARRLKMTNPNHFIGKARWLGHYADKCCDECPDCHICYMPADMHGPRPAPPDEPRNDETEVSAADALLRLCEEELAGCCGRHCHRCGLFKALRVLVGVMANPAFEATAADAGRILEYALAAARKENK